MPPTLSDELRSRLLAVDPGLQEGIRDLENLTPMGLWGRMADDDRVLALGVFLLDAIGEDNHRVLNALRRWLAETLNFRPKTVARWSIDEVIARAGKQSARPRARLPLDPVEVLAALHIKERHQILARYLDLLGIPHEDGQLSDLTLETGPAPDRAVSAFLGTLHEFPPDQVILYLLTLRFHTPLLCPDVDSWLPRLLEEAQESVELPADGGGVAAPPPATTPVDPASPGAEKEDPGEDAEATPSFTTLDQVVIRAVVAALQGVEGALSEDRIDELVEEILDLNSSRLRSHFHLGFVDGLRDRSYRDNLPAENEDRRSWYLAGFLTGLARHRRWDLVLHLVDNEPMLPRLKDSDARFLALPLVAEAFLEADRSGEIPGWLPADILARDPALAGRLRDRVTRLLREGRPADARGLLDLLDGGLEVARRMGYRVARAFALDLKRRRAHVHRQLGEYDIARGLLEGLLLEHRSPDVQAMAHADLGLVAGGFRSLGDIRIPPEAEHRVVLRERLELGRAHFEASAAEASGYAGHGHYALDLLRAIHASEADDWARAADHLERSLATFRSSADRYGPGTLLSTTRLYTGLALVLAMDAARAEEGIRLLEEVVDEGGKIPDAHLEELVTTLALWQDSGLNTERLVGLLCRSPSGRTLDFVSRTELGRHPAALTALQDRASRESRAGAARAADHRTLVPLLLEKGQVQAARNCLDALEDLALRGSGTSELLELLKDEGALDPAWEEEDVLACRVSLLEREGRLDEASRLLVKSFHQVLSDERMGATDSAAEILKRIRATAALAPEEIEQLRRRLEAAQAEEDGSDEDASAGPSPRRTIRVLFVGGDERQEREQAWLQAELARRHPHIQISFVHPGWGGNWGGTLEEALRKAQSHDAAVLMRFVRTEFGRSLRKSIPIPWAFCWGAGRETMLRSIVSAARAV